MNSNIRVRDIEVRLSHKLLLSNFACITDHCCHMEYAQSDDCDLPRSVNLESRREIALYKCSRWAGMAAARSCQ